jgi:phytoene/squalene synthetase
MANATEEAYRHCAAVTRAQAKNFYYAFLPLPPEIGRASCRERVSEVV